MIKTMTLFWVPAVVVTGSLADLAGDMARIAYPLLTILIIIAGLAIMTYPLHGSMPLLKPIGLFILTFLFILSVVKPLQAFTISQDEKLLGVIFLGILALALLLGTYLGRLFLRPIFGLLRWFMQILIVIPTQRRGMLYSIWSLVVIGAIISTVWASLYPSKTGIITAFGLWILVVVIRLVFGRFRQGFRHIKRNRLPGRRRQS